MSHPKLNTIAAIEIMQGEVDGDFDSLEEILLNNYSNRLSDNPTSSRYEDTNCPSSSIVDTTDSAYFSLASAARYAPASISFATSSRFTGLKL